MMTAGARALAPNVWMAGLLLSVVVLAGACNSPASNADAVEEPMRIRIVAADRTFTAVLEDTEAARDFAALLPFELTLSDYNRTEKIADLPRRISTAGSPDGLEPAAGDIAYYAPWGNLAIFYRDFDHSPGLVRLGRLDGNRGALAELDGAVRIEIISPV